MNILIINTFHYPRGGAEIYVFRLLDLLKKGGHTLIHFAMKSEDDFDSEYSDYFVSHIDYKEELKKKTPKALLNVVYRVFYSKESFGKIERLLTDEKIDIVHINNFLHHISLSIIKPIKRRNIPIVWTLHDHVLVCPNTNLFNDRKNSSCEICRSTGRRIVNPILQRCKKDSLGASFLASAETIFFKIKKVSKIPYKFISPSKFLMEQHRKMGFPVDRFEVVPNFVNLDNFTPNSKPGNYALYHGRLNPEKGLEVLIKAFRDLKYPLYIAGKGYLENYVKEMSEKYTNIKYLGFLQGEDLRNIIANSRFIIQPSLCFENAPLAVLEAFASSKPVIGSNIGGIPELVTEDCGILFKTSNEDSLKESVSELWHDSKKIEFLGRNALEKVKHDHTPRKHLEKILSIYNQAIEHHNVN